MLSVRLWQLICNYSVQQTSDCTRQYVVRRRHTIIKQHIKYHWIDIQTELPAEIVC